MVHLLAVLGLFLYPPTWEMFLFMWIMFFIQGSGITLAYHRCLTHRSFDFKYKWLERIYTTIGALSLQRGPIWWCGIHRIHHRHSDSLGDPHNQRAGFWNAHVLWFGHIDPRWNWAHRLDLYKDNVPDISSDPYYCWLDRYYYFPAFLLWALFYLIGGWAWVFWGGIIATVVHWHFTWAVNSLTHRIGYQSFETRDDSSNNWFIALFSSGEGWHNNHHAFPYSPKHGFFRWWEFDLTYLIILALKKLRIITNLKYPSVEKIKSSYLIPGVRSYQEQNVRGTRV